MSLPSSNTHSNIDTQGIDDIDGDNQTDTLNNVNSTVTSTVNNTANNSAHTHSSHNWRYGLRLSIPVAMGYVPAGIAFGVLSQVASVPAWAAILLSILLYAGAAQYACLPMLSAGMPVGSMASNIAAINLRHLFYGLPLLKSLPEQRLARGYCLFALTDETFSLLTSQPEQIRASVMLPVSLFNQSWWVLATVLGVAMGSAVADVIPHLDFALICLFAILAYEQFCYIRQSLPIFIAVLALLLAAVITTDWLLLTAIAISMGLILLLACASNHRKQPQHKEI